MTADERIRIGDILKRVSLGFFDKNSAGELAGAVTTDLSFVESFAMHMIDTVVNGYISAFAMVLCLSFYSVRVALAAVLGIGLSALFLKLLGDKSRANAPARQKAQDNTVAATLEYIRGMPVVKAYGQTGAAARSIRAAYRESRRINVKIEADFVPCNCFHLLSLKAASAAVVALAAAFAADGTMSIPHFLMMAVFSFVIFARVETVNNATHVLEVIDAAMNKLQRIEHAQFIDQDGRDMALSRYGIEMQDVAFGYDERKILKDVSFVMPQNTTTAIVGPSGGGKTTICSLIARFYDANRGDVRVGGVNVREMTCDSLLRMERPSSLSPTDWPP